MSLEQAHHLVDYQITGSLSARLAITGWRSGDNLLKVVTERFILGEYVGILRRKPILFDITGAASIRQLRQFLKQFLNPGPADDQWWQIRFREVAIVIRKLFAALWHSNTPGLNPATCFLMNRLTFAQHLNLTLRLICQRSLY